jgi:sarcosine oxidase
VSEAPDVAVVGAGIVGLATAHALAEAGERVRIFERGVPGNGISAAESRLFRHAHDDPRLATFTREGRAIWSEWEDRFGVELVSRDGVVGLGDSALSRLGVLEEIGGVQAREIDSDEIAQRLPLLAGFDGPAVFDEAGGAIRTRAAIATLAGELGNAIVSDEVISVRPTGSETVEVRSGRSCTEYPRAVVCAGRGTAALGHGMGLSIPVELSAHVRATFEVVGEPPDQAACLQDGSGEFGEIGTYGAPVPGNTRYSLGLAETTEADDAGVIDPASLAALGERATAYVERALPGLSPEPVELLHCWTTELPWGDDGVAVWERDRVLFVAGNNLFKQAPALGRAIARAVREDELPELLRPEARLGMAP